MFLVDKKAAASVLELTFLQRGHPGGRFSRDQQVTLPRVWQILVSLLRELAQTGRGTLLSAYKCHGSCRPPQPQHAQWLTHCSPTAVNAEPRQGPGRGSCTPNKES